MHTLTLVYSPSSRGSGARLSAPPARSSIHSASALSSLSLSRMRLRRPLEAAAAAHDDVVGALRALLVRQHLDGQRRRNGRLWRRLARAPEAVAGRPVGRPLPGSAELPRAARRTLRRRRGRAGALPRGHCQAGTFDRAAAPTTMSATYSVLVTLGGVVHLGWG